MDGAGYHVRRVGSPPRAATTYTDGVPERLEVNAIHWPSGENCGSPEQATVDDSATRRSCGAHHDVPCGRWYAARSDSIGPRINSAPYTTANTDATPNTIHNASGALPRPRTALLIDDAVMK